MSGTIYKFLFITVMCIVRVNCKDRPKIKTSDGDLILEPAVDKNVYLRPNGPQSRIFIGNIDVLKTNTPKKTIENQPSNKMLDKYLNGPNGILQRLQTLENRALAVPDATSFNITMISRRLNNVNKKVVAVQNQINNRPRGECDSQPCQHGGTCLNLVDGHHCLCLDTWEGTDCDVDVNECRNFAGTELGCQNGATCINRPGTYECLCKSSWFGQHCTSKAKDCSAGDFEMCGYGTCIPVISGEGIKCICHQGWTNNGTSLTCLTDINECESHHGPGCSVSPRVECINLPGSFRCGQCPVGYEGDGHICNDIDECITLNGGCSPMVTCHNTIGSRICGSCPPGYQGDGVTCTYRGSCSINHGGCHPSAQCVALPSPIGATVQCVCPEGMNGDGFGFAGCYASTGNYTQGCDSNPCGSHGQCHPVRSSYTCICYKGYGGANCDAPIDSCVVNPCQNGGVCKQGSISGFRCECTAQYSGSLCQVRLKACGGILDAEEGSIAFPLSNTSATYNHNAQCAWVIQTATDKVINVTFSKFNVELTEECSGDFLQIHDGRKSSAQLIGTFCGDTLPKGGNIVSNHNNLYLWFHSDEKLAKAGFTLHWTSVKPICGGEIAAITHGHISSPGSPGPYPPNRDCYWHLIAVPGKRISLHFFALDIEAHPNCDYDYLAIFDGDLMTDPLLSRYCNSTQPAPVQSASSDILIHFHSDAFGSGNGFQIAYAPIQGIPGCGGYFTADRGDIVSPTYNGAYLSNLLCEYKIKTSAETKIKINIKLFKLQYSFRCNNDYLKIYNGLSSNSPFVGKFCGTTYPATYTSSTNTLYIKFKTDRSKADEGFRITFEAICEKLLLGDSGVIKSPLYPFMYPPNTVCVYIITTEPGKAIQLTFQYFDIADRFNSRCRYDNVQVRDGHDINATLLGRYCGHYIPPIETSTHNYMYVRFESDSSVSGTGFYANYTTIDTECGGIYRDRSGSINHPSENATFYKENQSCQWLLVAPEGMHIELTWNRFQVQDMFHCKSDYLELAEINDRNEYNKLGKFCGNHAPPALTTTTNRLKLKFVSDSTISYAGFSLSYTFLDDSTNCGGKYIAAHGFIHSPGWPGNYEPNLDCTWIITVPAGQQILLNISSFDLERTLGNTGCNSYRDYLEIRNGDSDTSPLIGRFCGEYKLKRIPSLTNVLRLHFHSDSYLSTSGFSIEWDGTIAGCGGTLTSSTGSITSPNYPNRYNEVAECFYRIVTSAGSRIRISIIELDLEVTSRCNDDYIVEVYDGRNTNAALLGKYCFIYNSAKTDNVEKTENIETTANYAFIKLRYGLNIHLKGLVLNYITICINNLTSRYGIIESPDYPNSYPSFLKCVWTIVAPKGNRINVTFTHFNVQVASYLAYRLPWYSEPRRRVYDVDYDAGSRYHYPRYPVQGFEQCSLEYLRMKEIYDESFSKKYCGSSLPSAISSKSNAVQIEFSSYYESTLSGFRLEWVSYGCGGHIFKESGSVSLDKSVTTAKEMECEWLIETSPRKSIIITFVDIYMLNSKNCTIDAIEIYNGQNNKTPLLAKLCNEKSASIVSESNFMLVRFIKKSTLKDVHFTSQFRSQRSKCGGVINSMSGYFYSKNYPKNYNNNEDCIWYITVPENHRIEIIFIDLDLYYIPLIDVRSDYDNCGDTILIYETKDLNPSSNYTYRICRNANKIQVVTKYNYAVVQFKSDSQGTAKGFKANFSVTCGALIHATIDGIITNNNYINHSNKSCIWTIIAPTLEQKISLTLTQMVLPKDSDVVTNRNCPSAFLRVLDGNDDKAPLIGEYCGRKVPPMIVSHGNAITIELGTYIDKIVGKFSVHYSPIINACGGTMLTEEGTIASPLYPSPYPVDADCEWLLSTSPGNKAYITFERFDLEYSEGCNEDYLELRENDGAGNLLGVHCGHDIPTNCTKAAKIYIKFHSNSKTSSQGFLLHYGYLHENDIHGEYGEIASPLYPMPYEGAGEYIWRISTSSEDNIAVTVNRLEISSHGDVSYNKLTIYDGYDNTASVLEQFNGVVAESKTIVATSSVVYIALTMDGSNTGSMFHLTWTKASRNVILSKTDHHIDCGSNQTILLLPGQIEIIKSPNYPKNYRNDLNCEWIYRTQIGRHLSITFTEFELEERPACFADKILIYSADSPGNWKIVTETCKSEAVIGEINSSIYMKIQFKTDSSITRKGFLAKVRPQCGGIITDLSGEVGPDWRDVYTNSTNTKVKCEWTIKVRSGRTIQLKFNHFNITNKYGDCLTSLVLHNGDSAEAPLLASGKYCGYDHEVKSAIVTSSNALFLSYTSEYFGVQFIFQSFKLYYVERNYECGLTAKLMADHSWETINSPNYPSIPIPYTECIWIFTGPPGEILKIDFIDRFDIEYTYDCDKEAVEIRDGASSLSPSKGRYCGAKPGTIKSSSNTIYVKYTTQLAEPSNGFKANISIDVCGGTIIADYGEVISPGYPQMQVLPYGTVCEWHIIGPSGHTFLIKPLDISLPVTVSICDTKIDIKEMIPINNTITILKTICGPVSGKDLEAYVIETASNNFTITLTIGTSRVLGLVSQYKGFRISFNFSLHQCGGLITTSEGYLTTPRYPQETTLRYCTWKIIVPNKLRRIRLELIDINREKHRINMFNDFNYRNLLARISKYNNASENRIYESVSNKLTIALYNTLPTSHRFKAKFTSDEEALCGGDLSYLNQSLVAPDLQRSYSCDWHYNNQIATDAQNNFTYNTIFITAQVNSSVTNTRCGYLDPQILIKSPVNSLGRKAVFYRNICRNSEVSYRIPSSILDIRVSKGKSDSFNFNLNWKSQPCGGTVYIGENPTNIINVPDTYNDTLDCAWILIIPDNRVEIKMEGSFLLGCLDEFITISQGFYAITPFLERYCKGKFMNRPLLTHYAHIYVEYHSNVKRNTNIKLFVKTITHECGGLINSYQNKFTSPNYPKSYNANEECTWDIHAGLGYRISLQFIGRFVVEDKPNCTKDVVIIYDWIDDDIYKEIGRACGRQAPLPYNSTYNHLKVVFRTDAETNLDGFSAQWTSFCGGNYVATDKEQILYSPGNSYGLKSNMHCLYKLSAPNKNKILLKFLEFKLDGVYPECGSSNLTITGKNSNNDDVYKVLCGYQLPAAMANFEKVILEYTTGGHYIHTLLNIGFKLSYSIYKCGGRVNDTTVITSTFGDDDYNENMNCTWLIEAPPYKIVVVKFLYIDLETTLKCDFDYVALYDGLEVNMDKRLALLCGHVNSTTVLRSTGNSMVLEFITDSSQNYKGFEAAIYFSYSEVVGCGGQVNLTDGASHVLKSPLISNVVYENFLDCHWSIISPPNTVVKITFTKFHIAPCRSVNQTAIRLYSECDCDFVEVKDGFNPNSLVIGTYCGHVVPPQLTSSVNVMSVRLSTDGELVSSGFEATLTVQPTLCGESVIPVSFTPRHFKSPGYDQGSVPRSLHCVYHLDGSAEPNIEVRITVINLELSPSILDSANVTRCLKDKLVISNSPSNHNTTFGKNLIMNHDTSDFFTHAYSFERNINLPNRIELCGHQDTVEFYVIGGISINLITSPEADNEVHRGVEIAVAFAGICGRNYTEPQGRIVSSIIRSSADKINYNCYILITAPENFTISAYFLTENLYDEFYDNLYDDEDTYLEIFDGNQTSARQLTIKYDKNNEPVFSTGRYMLLHTHHTDYDHFSYDINYVTTNKGSGCGGKLINIVGAVTSPFYPNTLRHNSICEWILETPVNTNLMIRFTDFDLGDICNQNYLQLVDSKGVVVRTFCSESPADYTSDDNYIKLVFYTTQNNSGKGWSALFRGTKV